MKAIILSLLTLCAVQFSSACSCMSMGGYLCETFQNDPTISLIVLCKKVDTVGYGFKVQRLYNYYGTETRDTLLIWGDNGALCRLYDTWQNGDSLLMMLHTCDTAGNEIKNPDYAYLTREERVTDYTISGCGAYMVEVSNSHAVGYITQPSTIEVSLTALMQTNCFNRQSTGIPNQPELELNMLQTGHALQVTSAVSANFPLNIYNLTGSLVKTAEITQGLNTITTRGLANGVYVASAIYNGRPFQYRFVVGY